MGRSSDLSKSVKRFKNNTFLFQELIKRDFKKKYKNTVLGVFWSVLSPLLTLLVLRIVFTEFFGRDVPHYTTYLFCGTLVMSYYSEATKSGMTSLIANARVITKINIPKYLFLFSRNIAALINMSVTLIVFFAFVWADGISFSNRLLFLVFPLVCLMVMNVGVGMILSVLYVFFRDIEYLYDVFLTLLRYLSVIFYTLDRFPVEIQRLFLLNPVYVFIKYFRTVVIDMRIPSVHYHGLCLLYSFGLLGIGFCLYKKYNTSFVYYL